MGRGRQKAKQTKVARELKYHSSAIDVTALQRELSGGQDEHGYAGRREPDHSGADDGDDDPYGAYGSEDEDETSDYASQSRGR